MQAVRRRAMQGACLTLAIAAVTVQVVRAAPAPTGTVKYGIVFDAGSSGSRIHVYSWRVGGGGPKDAFDLIADKLLKKKPGLSAYKEKPAEAGSSLRELLDHARAEIPAALHAETPIFLMATAGLRMVGEKAKDEILASVCAELSSSGFLFRCELSWTRTPRGLRLRTVRTGYACQPPVRARGAGQLAPGGHYCTYRRTRTSLGCAVRAACRVPWHLRLQGCDTAQRHGRGPVRLGHGQLPARRALSAGHHAARGHHRPGRRQRAGRRRKSVSQ